MLNFIFEISPKGRRILKKICAAYMAIMSVALIWGYFQSMNVYGGGQVGHIVTSKTFGVLVIYTLTSCLYLGFTVLWIVSHFWGSARKSLLMKLIAMNIAIPAFFLAISTYLTPLGWTLFFEVNNVVLGINSFFAIAYFFNDVE